jgi:hypothetical protein
MGVYFELPSIKIETMPINSVVTCPTYYYYQGDQCNGYTTYSFRSATAIMASVVKITGSICVSNITTGSANANDVISTHTSCNSCLGLEATLAWSFSETGGASGQMDLYVNGSMIESRSNTSNGTYTVLVGDTINVQVSCDTCPFEYSNATCTGIINDTACGYDSSSSIFTSVYTVTSGNAGNTINLDSFATCTGACL